MSKLPWTEKMWDPVVQYRKMGVSWPYFWGGSISRLRHRVLRRPTVIGQSEMCFCFERGDLFHHSVPEWWIDQVMLVAAMNAQHTFRILTESPRRMRDYFSCSDWRMRTELAEKSGDSCVLPNVMLGVNVETQAQAKDRIPELLNTPASMRYIVTLPQWMDNDWIDPLDGSPKLDWVVCKCVTESDSNATCYLKEQCELSETPFFMKQMVNGGKVVKELHEFPVHLRVREWPRFMGKDNDNEEA